MLRVSQFAGIAVTADALVAGVADVRRFGSYPGQEIIGAELAVIDISDKKRGLISECRWFLGCQLLTLIWKKKRIWSYLSLTADSPVVISD